MRKWTGRFTLQQGSLSLVTSFRPCLCIHLHFLPGLGVGGLEVKGVEAEIAGCGSVLDLKGGLGRRNKEVRGKGKRMMCRIYLYECVHVCEVVGGGRRVGRQL